MTSLWAHINKCAPLKFRAAPPLALENKIVPELSGHREYLSLFIVALAHPIQIQIQYNEQSKLLFQPCSVIEQISNKNFDSDND